MLSVPSKWQSLEGKGPLFVGTKPTWCQFLKFPVNTKRRPDDPSTWETANAAKPKYNDVRSKWTRDILEYRDKLDARKQAQDEQSGLQSKLRSQATDALRRKDKWMKVPMVSAGDTPGPPRPVSVLEGSPKSPPPRRAITCEPITKRQEALYPVECEKYHTLLKMAAAHNTAVSLRHLAETLTTEQEQRIKADDALMATVEDRTLKARERLRTEVKEKNRAARLRRRLMEEQRKEREEMEAAKAPVAPPKKQPARVGPTLEETQKVRDEYHEKLRTKREAAQQRYRRITEQQEAEEAQIEQGIRARESQLEDRLARREQGRRMRAFETEVCWLHSLSQCQQQKKHLESARIKGLTAAAAKRDEAVLKRGEERVGQLGLKQKRNTERSAQATAKVDAIYAQDEAGVKMLLHENNLREEQLQERLNTIQAERAQRVEESAAHRQERYSHAVAQREEKRNNLLDRLEQQAALLSTSPAHTRPPLQKAEPVSRLNDVYQYMEVEEQRRREAAAAKEAATEELLAQMRVDRQKKAEALDKHWKEGVERGFAGRATDREALIRKVTEDLRQKELKMDEVRRHKKDFEQEVRERNQRESLKAAERARLLKEREEEADSRRLTQYQRHMIKVQASRERKEGTNRTRSARALTLRTARSTSSLRQVEEDISTVGSPREGDSDYTTESD